MKTGLLLILLFSQSAQAQMFWWSACKKTCWYQYKTCVSSNSRHWQALEEGASDGEIMIYEQYRLRANGACVGERRDCFAACNQNKHSQ